VSDQFDEWLDSGLAFTIGGREFRVESPSALTILSLHRELAGQKVNDATERDSIRAVLGDTWDEMQVAGIPELSALHAGRTAIAKYLDTADAALAVWQFRDPRKPDDPPVRREPSIYGVAPDDAVDPPGTINDYDPGGGPYMPDKGLRVWAYPMECCPAAQPGYVPFEERTPKASWLDIFEAWDAIEMDFELFCHHDLTPELLRARSWRWFAIRLSRILGDRDSLSSRIIASRKQVDDGDETG
jgi:hypothetical protein